MPKKDQYPLGHSPVLSGKICPYCDSPSVYTDSADVYGGTSYGMIWLCRPCQAWVGVHEGTDQALGRLASAELRELKMQAHRWFDPIARQGLIKDIYPIYIAGMSERDKAYLWLSEIMGIKKEYCHIGMMDEGECQQVIDICKPFVEPYE
jgi:hypothetical protein